jgi:dihydrolipoamide dehydrogenase
MNVDLFVVGSGPGGYHAAIRGAQFGLKVAVAEREYIGGVCLNVGCIPTKALLHVGEEIRKTSKGAEFGLNVHDWNLDLKALGAHRDKVVKKLTGGVSSLFKGNGVEVIRGDARLVSRTKAKVGGTEVTFKNCIVATGSEPARLPGFEVDGHDVVDSTSALLIDEVPGRFLAVGCGAIGLEFATIYNRLGSEVKLIELLDRLAPGVDEDIGAALKKALNKQGITVQTGTKANGYERKADGLHVELEDVKTGETRSEVFDRILVAIGRKPRGHNLGLEALGVTVEERGFIPVNSRLETGVPGIYAIGDVIGGPMLAHKAMKEGVVAAERCAGKASAMDAVAVPGVIYTTPEVAWVGPTERELREQGRDLRIGRFPLTASARALTLGSQDGLMKLIADAKTDHVLGIHLCGPAASDLIGEAALALEVAATAEDIALTIHPHPTMSETLLEIAEAAHEQSIHILNRPVKAGR